MCLGVSPWSEELLEVIDDCTSFWWKLLGCETIVVDDFQEFEGSLLELVADGEEWGCDGGWKKLQGVCDAL